MRKLILAAGIALVLCAAALLAAGPAIETRFNRTLQRAPYKASPQAVKLHSSLLVADLHADTLLWNRDLLRRSATGHVDLPRLSQGNVALQTFTVVTQIPRGLNIQKNQGSTDLVRYLAVAEGWPARTWNSPKQRALYQAAQLRKYEAESNGQLAIVRSKTDLQRILADRASHHNVVAALLGSEGAQPLEGDLRNLDELYNAGFRLMGPAHFTDTAVAGSAAGTSKEGLTPLGREWVRRMEEKRMVIDLAHASAATIRDVTALARKPVIVSHTGVKGTCDNNRNLSDEQLRAIARTGGVVGIGYWETATCGRDATAIARAIRHSANIAGVEHVALGSDFDGATTMPFDTSGLVLITDALLKQGFSEHEIRLIMGENTIRVLSQILPD